MIRHAVRHLTGVAVVVVENLRVALPRAAVVDDDIAPAVALHRRTVDSILDGAREVAILWLASPEDPPPLFLRGRGRLQPGFFFESRFFDHNRWRRGRPLLCGYDCARWWRRSRRGGGSRRWCGGGC